jgi:hypothetical protein
MKAFAIFAFLLFLFAILAHNPLNAAATTPYVYVYDPAKEGYVYDYSKVGEECGSNVIRGSTADCPSGYSCSNWDEGYIRATKRCPEDMPSCDSIPGMEGPRCHVYDILSWFRCPEGKELSIARTYPGKIKCSEPVHSEPANPNEPQSAVYGTPYEPPQTIEVTPLPLSEQHPPSQLTQTSPEPSEEENSAKPQPSPTDAPAPMGAKYVYDPAKEGYVYDYSKVGQECGYKQIGDGNVTCPAGQRCWEMFGGTYLDIRCPDDMPSCDNIPGVKGARCTVRDTISFFRCPEGKSPSVFLSYPGDIACEKLDWNTAQRCDSNKKCPMENFECDFIPGVDGARCHPPNLPKWYICPDDQEMHHQPGYPGTYSCGTTGGDMLSGIYSAFDSFWAAIFGRKK